MEKHSLRVTRLISGKSAKEVSEAAGISEDTLYRYETGKSSPQIGTAIKLANIYGVSIDMIDFGVDEGSE